ncbi:MAG: DUF6941 family protein [Gemmataceae bacterium]
MTVCDGVRESTTEAGVYHLRGVRQRIRARAFPFVTFRLWCFLVLSSHRPGEYPGYIRVIDDGTDKAIFYGKLTPPPTFEANVEIVVNVMQLKCSFPQPGRYTVQIWFFQEQGRDVLKGELSFTVSTEGA